MKSSFIGSEPIRQQTRRRILDLLGQYGPAEAMLSEIEQRMATALTDLRMNTGQPRPREVHADLLKLADALAAIDELLGSNSGSARTLLAGEAVAHDLLPQFLALEDAVIAAQGTLAPIAEAAANSIDDQIKRGKPNSVEAASRRWLVERIAAITRRHGLEWRRDGDFLELIEAIWEGIGFDHAERDIRDAIETGLA